MKQNAFINALRGFSALWVVIAHCCIWGGYKGYIPDPKVAVDIFMMVSGFLMMYTVNLTHKNEPFELRRNWLKFYIRRFFRISPAYYLSLFVAITLYRIYVPSYQELGRLNHNLKLANLSADFSLSNMLLHISYVFGLVPSKAFSTLLPDWSLSLEMQFYFLFPVIFMFFHKNPSRRKIIAFTIVAIIVSLLSKKFIMNVFTESSLILYQLPMFLIGILIYKFSIKGANKENKYFYAFTAMLLCLYSMIIKNHHDNIYLLFAALFLIISLRGNLLAKKVNLFFDKVLFLKMSDLSFSVYLFHGFFLSILGALIEKKLYLQGYNSNQCVLIIILVVIIFTYLFAFVVHKYIELPGIKFGKLVIKNLQNKNEIS